MTIEFKPHIKMDVNSLGANPLKIYLLALIVVVVSLGIVFLIMKGLEKGYKVSVNEVRTKYLLSLQPMIMTFFLSHPGTNPLIEILNTKEMTIKTTFTFLLPSTMMFIGLAFVASIAPIMGSSLLAKYIKRKFDLDISWTLTLLSIIVWILATLVLVKTTPLIMPIFLK